MDKVTWGKGDMEIGRHGDKETWGFGDREISGQLGKMELKAEAYVRNFQKISEFSNYFMGLPTKRI